MEGIYYKLDLSNDKFTPQDKFKMFNRIMSCSDKLREHVLKCKDKDCKVHQKIIFFILSFLIFEKQENQEIDISKIMDEEMVDDSFLSDKFVKILEIKKMDMNHLSLTAELFKNSKYFQDHVKNETREQRKNCRFCNEVVPSFVQLYLNREKELGRTIYIDAKRADEILHLWEMLYEKHA